jgi:hypothetical protein
MNVTIPFNACKHEQWADAQCSVVVEIDFKNEHVSGELDIEKRTNVASLRTETKFQLESNSIMSTVWYTCTMSDYCDFDFLNELLTNKLAEFNATSIQQKLIDLLYTSTPDPTGIQCANGTCPSNSFCQAYLGNLIISKYNYTYINGSLSCVNLSSTDDFLKITENFFPYASEMIEMTVQCNTKECNSNNTVTEAYALLRNDFVLPLNYSILDINTSFIITTTPLPSGASFFVSLHSLIIFYAMFLLSD